MDREFAKELIGDFKKLTFFLEEVSENTNVKGKYYLREVYAIIYEMSRKIVQESEGFEETETSDPKES